MISARKKTVTHDPVGIIMQYARLVVFAKRELSAIKLQESVLKPVNVENVLM